MRARFPSISEEIETAVVSGRIPKIDPDERDEAAQAVIERTDHGNRVAARVLYESSLRVIPSLLRVVSRG